MLQHRSYHADYPWYTSINILQRDGEKFADMHDIPVERQELPRQKKLLLAKDRFRF
jgi:hypothetical protein